MLDVMIQACESKERLRVGQTQAKAILLTKVMLMNGDVICVL